MKKVKASNFIFIYIVITSIIFKGIVKSAYRVCSLLDQFWCQMTVEIILLSNRNMTVIKIEFHYYWLRPLHYFGIVIGQNLYYSVPSPTRVAQTRQDSGVRCGRDSQLKNCLPRAASLRPIAARLAIFLDLCHKLGHGESSARGEGERWLIRIQTSKECLEFRWAPKHPLKRNIAPCKNYISKDANDCVTGGESGEIRNFKYKWLFLKMFIHNCWKNFAALSLFDFLDYQFLAFFLLRSINFYSISRNEISSDPIVAFGK